MERERIIELMNMPEQELLETVSPEELEDYIAEARKRLKKVEMGYTPERMARMQRGLESILSKMQPAEAQNVLDQIEGISQGINATDPQKRLNAIKCLLDIGDICEYEVRTLH